MLDDSRIVLGPITRTGRVLGDDITNFALDRQGRIYSIRKGVNELPANRVEVISGRFRPQL